MDSGSKNKSLKPLCFNDLFQYRSFMMGMGMIWIVLYHCGLRYNNTVFQFIKSIGYGGVDIFLFCSGFGCYFSYNKDCDSFAFIKRRFLRIYPEWFLFMCIWIPVNLWINHISVRAVIGNILGIQSLTGQGGHFNWYISALIILYLLSPYLASICKRFSFMKNIAVLLILVIVSIPFWKNRALIISISRLPIFYLGMIAARFCKKRLTIKNVLPLFLLSIGGVWGLDLAMTFQRDKLWSHALWWYPFILIVPGLCVLLGMIAHLLQKPVLRLIVKVVTAVGEHSFEIYLFHILIFQLLRWFHSQKVIVLTNTIWLLSFPLVYLCSCVFKIIHTCIQQRFLEKN